MSEHSIHWLEYNCTSHVNLYKIPPVNIINSQTQTSFANTQKIIVITQF